MILSGLLSMFETTFECIGAHPILSLMLPQITDKQLKLKHDERPTLNETSLLSGTIQEDS
jgi:hypothetical protein